MHVEDGPGKVPLATFHKELCNFIESDPGHKKLALLPRGHLKSTIITANYATKRIVEQPDIRILIQNATSANAIDFLTEIKKNLTQNEDLIRIYKDPDKPWIADNPLEWSADRITLNVPKLGKKGPTVTASGIDVNLVSQHYDMIIMDDVVNRENTFTKDQIQKVILRYKDNLDLLEPGGELIVIGTRWNYDDLYGWILDPKGDVRKGFKTMIKQAYQGDLWDDPIILWSEKYTAKDLQDLYRQKGSYEFSCTPQETPILMADWTYKPISQIQAGDRVIGFTKGMAKVKSRLVPTVVKHVMQKEDVVQTLVMKKGRAIRCTADHNWYTGREDPTHKRYKPAKVGSKLRLVLDPIVEPVDREALTYLAGIIDGEGSFKSGGCISIAQSEVKNKETYETILKALNKLELQYSLYHRAASSGHAPSTIITIKQSTRLCELLITLPWFGKRDQAYEWLYKKASRFVKEKDEVMAIYEDGLEQVYALETETGNYIAWGYASSNCQYMNDPISMEDAKFKREHFHYYHLDDLRGLPLNKYLLIDPAFETKKDSDNTAMVSIGIDDENNVWILDVLKGKFHPKQTIELMFSLYEKHHYLGIGIEDITFGKTLQYHLNDEMKQRKKWLPIIKLKPGERSKDARIMGLQPLYEAGKVFHCKDGRGIQYLEEELLRYPRSAHDDIIDALAYGPDIMAPVRKKKETRWRHRYLY